MDYIRMVSAMLLFGFVHLFFDCASVFAIRVDYAKMPFYGECSLRLVGRTGEVYSQKRIVYISDEILIQEETVGDVSFSNLYLVMRVPGLLSQSKFYVPLAIIRPVFKDGPGIYVGEVIESFDVLDGQSNNNIYEFNWVDRKINVEPVQFHDVYKGYVGELLNDQSFAYTGDYLGACFKGNIDREIPMGTKVYFFKEVPFLTKLFKAFSFGKKNGPPKITAEGILLSLNVPYATLLVTKSEYPISVGANFTTVIY